jgi:hypothetical protein
MTVVGEAHGGSRSVAWADVLGAGALMVLVIGCGGLGLGLSLVFLLGFLGLPVDTDLMSVLRQALTP